MSQENLDTIRAFYEAYNRRDFDHLPKPLHPDIEVVPAGGQSPIKGARGFALGWSQTRSNPR